MDSPSQRVSHQEREYVFLNRLQAQFSQFIPKRRQKARTNRGCLKAGTQAEPPAGAHGSTPHSLDLCNSQALTKGTGLSFCDGTIKTGQDIPRRWPAAHCKLRRLCSPLLGRCFISDLMAVFGTALFYPQRTPSHRSAAALARFHEQ